MATVLFDSIIFGPIQSRRLGVSLGVNLIHPESKLCNFDCIYCECGWNSEGKKGAGFNTLEDVIKALEKWIMENPKIRLDYITFAGNGEPTMHPEFEKVIDATLEIRDRLTPQAKVAVLSNSTMIDRVEVVDALMRVERPILKFDSAVQSTYLALNQPQKKRTVTQIVELLKKLKGRFVMQTMFLRGGRIDNTTPVEVQKWLKVVEETRPREVMIYSLDRDTPQSGLEKISTMELRTIAQLVEELGIATNVPGQ